MKKSTIKIAKSLIFAADLRENSYNNHSNMYDKPLYDAVEFACNKYKITDLQMLILYLLSENWNSSLDWANGILNK